MAFGSFMCVATRRTEGENGNSCLDTYINEDNKSNVLSKSLRTAAGKSTCLLTTETVART